VCGRAQGFVPGSSDYVQCRKQLDNQHPKNDPERYEARPIKSAPHIGMVSCKTPPLNVMLE
jgi:hypothetical protein